MSWSFDISAAPRDRQILMRTTRDGDKVFVTNWLEPTKHCPNGRFNGFSENAKSLLAWCEIPAFTNSQEAATETMGGTGDDCSFGNRGVWPPQGGASSSRGNDSLRVVTAGETETGIHANPEEMGVHGEAESVPVVDAGSRPAIGRSMAATSEIMDATGGESAASQFILDDCGSGA